MTYSSLQSIFTNVLGVKRAAPKVVSKLLNYEQKQHRMYTAQEMLTTFNDDPDLLKKVITGYESCEYDGSIQKRQNRKKHVKFGQMCMFRSLLSSIVMAWSITNSCYKVLWLIRNITLKLR